MKQQNLFGEDPTEKTESEYTSKIKAPIYEPKYKKPFVFELVDTTKRGRLINDINNSTLPQEEKDFLIHAANRHNVFNYELIADYYAHATPEMQSLMERSALVIIDFDKAIQYGYVKFSNEIADIYIKEHGKA